MSTTSVIGREPITEVRATVRITDPYTDEKRTMSRYAVYPTNPADPMYIRFVLVDRSEAPFREHDAYVRRSYAEYLADRMNAGLSLDEAVAEYAEGRS